MNSDRNMERNTYCTHATNIYFNLLWICCKLTTNPQQIEVTDLDLGLLWSDILTVHVSGLRAYHFTYLKSSIQPRSDK